MTDSTVVVLVHTMDAGSVFRAVLVAGVAVLLLLVIAALNGVEVSKSDRR